MFNHPRIRVLQSRGSHADAIQLVHRSSAGSTIQARPFQTNHGSGSIQRRPPTGRRGPEWKAHRVDSRRRILREILDVIWVDNFLCRFDRSILPRQVQCEVSSLFCHSFVMPWKNACLPFTGVMATCLRVVAPALGFLLLAARLNVDVSGTSN